MKKWNVKQLARVHKKFAAEYFDNDAEAKADEVITEHPELAAIRDTLIAQYSSDEDTAILGGALDICEFFSEENRTQGMEFSSPHTKSVTMTLHSNLAAYRNFEQFLNEEPSDDYAAVYNKLMNDFEDYFVLASEDMLCDYYTDYREFRDSYIEKENARNKAAAEKRAQKRESQE
ncbi:hypothetical protein ACTQ2Q_07515 [Atopobiaceae bacterium LCP21S3_F11]